MTLFLTLALAFFNMTGVRASRVLGVLFAIKLGAAPFTIGALAATFALFPLLLSWPAGRIVDRYGPRTPLLMGAVGSAIGMLLPCFWPSLVAVFAAAAMTGIATTFYSIALQNMVGVFSTAENRARNYSNYAMAISTAASAGPLLAGFSFDNVGPAVAFFFGALCFLVPAIMLAIWGGMLPRAKPTEAPPMNVRDVLTNPGVWPVLVASSLAQTGLDLFQFYIPVYGDSHGLSSSAIGIVIAMCAVGGFAARVILPSWIKWLNEEKVLAHALILSGFSLVLVPFVTTAPALSVIAFVFGFGLNVTQPISLIIMYARSPEGRSGEALGVRFAADNSTKLVGPMIFGAIAGAMGVAPLFWINAAMLVAGGFVMGKTARKKS
ncbi:MAG: major facilitator superfamily 1 [Betaproteobacteria bacterium]|nr:major facilitator superfamily 1 [Betaproteobacteria bacterium]